MKSPAVHALLMLGGLVASNAVDAQPAAVRWSVGMGMVTTASPYVGEGTRVRAFPFVGWEGERAYLRGLDLGFRVHESGPWVLDAALSARLDGFDARDLDAGDLATAGIDRATLDDRNDGVDASLKLRWRGTATELQAEARHDISGASGGSELRLRAGWPLQAGSWRWTPYLQGNWLSSDLGDYYYGLEADEVLPGQSAYRPGSAWVPELGLGLNRGFASGWFVLANLRVSALPDALADSPLLEDDAQAGLFIAVGRGF